MIDFASIKKTPCGRACHYFGKRIGLEGSTLHCFGVWAEYGVLERCYNDAGQRLVLRGGKWVVDSRSDPIAPNAELWANAPRLLEVLRKVLTYADMSTGWQHLDEAEQAFTEAHELLEKHGG